jgi:hypothetical protein
MMRRVVLLGVVLQMIRQAMIANINPTVSQFGLNSVIQLALCERIVSIDRVVLVEVHHGLINRARYKAIVIANLESRNGHRIAALIGQ